MNQIVKSRQHQGVAAELATAPILDIHTVQELPERLVILDGIQDPHNFGAALRVCENFGFRDVLFQKDNSSGLTPAAVKASTGACFYLSLYQGRLNQAMKRMVKESFKIYVFDSAATITIADIKDAVTPPYCVVVGSEGRGVRHTIKRQASATVRIPALGRISSLNVSCALAVALYECSVERKLKTRGYPEKGLTQRRKDAKKDDGENFVY